MRDESQSLPVVKLALYLLSGTDRNEVGPRKWVILVVFLHGLNQCPIFFVVTWISPDAVRPYIGIILVCKPEIGTSMRMQSSKSS